MDRREALKNVAFLMGGTIIGTQFLTVACQPDNEQKAEEVKRVFTRQDIALMDEIGETIIPATDTPGARAVGIGNFMAMMVIDCYDGKNRKAFKEGLEKIRENFDKAYGHAFEAGDVKERTSFLHHLDKEVASYNSEKKEEEPEHYFRMLKELTLLGYFTSEAGSTQALKYSQTPGRYDNCIPYQKGDKAWAAT